MFPSDNSFFNGAAPQRPVFSSRPDPQDNVFFVYFFYKEVPDHEKTRLNGYPSFKQVEMIHIEKPGSKQVDELLVTEGFKARFPAEYRAFIEKSDKPAEGYLLEFWPILDRVRVAELNAQKIFTVEQLAALSDGQLHVLGMGGLELRKKAQDFLAQSKDASVLSSIRDENAQLKSQVDTLRKQIEDLTRLYTESGAKVSLSVPVDSQVAEVTSVVESVAPKKRGRPKKQIS